MATENTESKIKEIVAEILKIEPKTIQSESTFEDLNVDSLDMVEIIMKMEEEFDIEISDEQAEKIKSIRDAVEKVQELKKEL